MVKVRLSDDPSSTSVSVVFEVTSERLSFSSTR